MWKEPPGQATFEMANLRPKTTGLKFVVYISQRDGANHAARVKVSPGPRVNTQDMGVYAVRPFRHVAGPPLSSSDEKDLEHWIAINEPMLHGLWDADIEYMEEAIERVIKV
jgi:hypothetical protein